jgi:hypothetical protein
LQKERSYKIKAIKEKATKKLGKIKARKNKSSEK